VIDAAHNMHQRPSNHASKFVSVLAPSARPPGSSPEAGGAAPPPPPSASSLPPTAPSLPLPPRLLFLSRGSDPTTHPRVGSFKATRVFDPTIRGFHVTLDAGLRSNAALDLDVAPPPPAFSAREAARPPHPLLLLQLRLPAGPVPGVDASLTHLTVTLGLAGAEESLSRRLVLSTAYRSPAVTALHVQLPLAGRLLGTAAPTCAQGVPRAVWVQLVLAWADIAAAAWPVADGRANAVAALRVSTVQLRGSADVRVVALLDAQPGDVGGGRFNCDALPEPAAFPRACAARALALTALIGAPELLQRRAAAPAAGASPHSPAVPPAARTAPPPPPRRFPSEAAVVPPMCYPAEAAVAAAEGEAGVAGTAELAPPLRPGSPLQALFLRDVGRRARIDGMLAPPASASAFAAAIVASPKTSALLLASASSLAPPASRLPLHRQWAPLPSPPPPPRPSPPAPLVLPPQRGSGGSSEGEPRRIVAPLSSPVQSAALFLPAAACAEPPVPQPSSPPPPPPALTAPSTPSAAPRALPSPAASPIVGPSRVVRCTPVASPAAIKATAAVLSGARAQARRGGSATPLRGAAASSPRSNNPSRVPAPPTPELQPLARELIFASAPPSLNASLSAAAPPPLPLPLPEAPASTRSPGAWLSNHMQGHAELDAELELLLASVRAGARAAEEE
jgi:hypothetical protein